MAEKVARQDVGLGARGHWRGAARMKPGPTEWRASKRYHAKFCLPLVLVPSIQRRRPTETMLVHIGMKGAAGLIEAQSVSISSHVGRLRAKVLDQRVHERSCVRRVRDDRVGNVRTFAVSATDR